MLAENFIVNSPNTEMKGTEMFTKYEYHTDVLTKDATGVKITPKTEIFEFKTETKVPKTGLMLIGLGGNNGTTLTAGVLANKKKLQWDTKRGVQAANYHGSLTQCSTTYLGRDEKGETFVAPFKSLLPMVNPNDLVIGGWDISKMNMFDATKRALVLEPSMYNQLKDDLSVIVPLPSIFDISFLAPNQKSRADNVIPGNKQEQLETVRKHMREFKEKNKLDKVIVFWTANTERFCVVKPDVHVTADKLLAGIKANDEEISPSLLYAVASVLEHNCFINGSPQNTLVPGLIELAEREKVNIMGDDLKTGQTKFKSVMADFLISSGLKLTAVASYNHLGNNDGMNLDFDLCFKSKEISKKSVIDDLVGNNPILYPNNEHPDHCVVIKYMPSVGDSKRALDEYDSMIFCGGENVISVHNTCEDSLLAAPLMLDMVILMEIFTRVQFKTADIKEYTSMNTIMSAISFLFKAPHAPKGTPVINALFPQRSCMENILRATRGLQPINHMHLEWKLPSKV